MDGVLIDSYTAWYHVFNESLNHFENRTISKEEYDKNVWAVSLKVTAKNYFKVDEIEIRKFFEGNQELFDQHLKEFPLVRETLEELKKKGLILAVATNSTTNITKEVLENLGLIQFFDNVIGGNEVPHGKPEPDMLFVTLDRLGIEKDEALFIGDTEWDRKAARKADIKFIGLRTEGDIEIVRFEEILEVISKQYP